MHRGRGPVVGRAAYLALLASTTLGTVSSTIMSAPINEIAGSLGAGPQEIVLAVSAFTVAMVVCAPFAGWLSDRIGATTFLLGALVLMVVAQLGAALAPSLWVMVAMRALQGVACSGIPPAVQQGLTGFWPDRTRQTMGAWASAIGIGQASGRPPGASSPTCSGGGPCSGCTRASARSWRSRCGGSSRGCPGADRRSTSEAWRRSWPAPDASSPR